MDTDYLTLAVLLAVFGVVGMTATAGVHPTPANCNCIPSPAARFQELSVIVFAFGVALTPVAILRRGTRPVAPLSTAGRGAYAGPVLRNGELFFLGMALVVFGVALVAIPSFIVLRNPALIAEGVVVVVVGLLFAYRGGRLY